MPAEVFIMSGVRTPIGAMSGALADVPAPELGAICIKEAVQRAGVKPEAVDEVIIGNVVAAGIGQNPARQATIKAGLPASVGATTVNKVCGSGLKAVMLAAQIDPARRGGRRRRRRHGEHDPRPVPADQGPRRATAWATAS